MLWLYLLGAVTILTIAVRRLLRRQKPLINEVFSKRIAMDHVHDGVAWIEADGRIDYSNPALGRMLETSPERLRGTKWFEMFAGYERARVEDGYRQMLLAGKASFNAQVIDAGGGLTRRNVLLVAVHDHKARLAGHHCIVQDRALKNEPEDRLAFAGRN